MTRHHNLRDKKECGQKCLVKVFVYGTLMRGHGNHEAFCRGAVSVEPAEVWGRLYRYCAGFPALEVPEDAILAKGTEDPVADALLQAKIAASVNGNAELVRPEGDWDLISGDLITFDDPEIRLPSIDGLEGFRPGEDWFYERVLVLVRASKVVPAWVYRMIDPTGERIERRWEG